MVKKLIKSILTAIAVAAFWILIWYFAALQVGKELLLPSPLSVLKRLAEIMESKEFYITTAYSLIRVMSGIVLASFIGVLLSIMTHLSRIAAALVRPVITVIKATPVASFIILALVWLERGNLPAFISLLMVLPVIWTNLTTGLSQIDTKLLELAKVYKIGFFQKIKGIYIPSVMPYFSSALKTSLGLAWKAGIAAEVLAVPARSIGKELFNSKTYFETADLFAWTVVVIILSLIIEFIFEALLGKLTERRTKNAEN